MRIRRADLPEQNSQAVYQRMQTERQREAAEFRAQGSQRAQEIRAKADRDVTVLIAEATVEAEQIRGEGDAERNRIFADAFGQDPDFFAFYRSMQAYEAGLKHEDTRMLLKPDSEFFRFFGTSGGKPRDGRTAIGVRATGRSRSKDVRFCRGHRSRACHRGAAVRSLSGAAKRLAAHALESPEAILADRRRGVGRARRRAGLADARMTMCTPACRRSPDSALIRHA